MAFVVMFSVVMAGWIVGAVLGDGGPGAAHGQRQRNRGGCGYACEKSHFCLLMDEFRS
jgi:hypothetical protein